MILSCLKSYIYCFSLTPHLKMEHHNKIIQISLYISRPFGMYSHLYHEGQF